MAYRDPFIAEVAVDFEHALKATDDQALQVQLGRNAQVHLLIQCIVVRDEGLGVGTAGDGVQHGRFDFQEAVLHHEVANAGHGLAAGHEALAGVFVHHQVDVALAHLLLGVGHAVELVGHRAQALGEQANLAGLDRQFAGLGLHQLAFDGDDVAQVPLLEVGVDLFAHGVAGDVGLDAAGGVLHGGKAGLAHHALEHHATAHRDGDGFGVQRLGFLGAMGLDQRQGAVGGLEVVGESHATVGLDGLAQGFQFFAALSNQFVFVLGGSDFCLGGVVLFRHG